MEKISKQRKNLTRNCPSTILKAVPSNYVKITFMELHARENYTDKAIIGKICQLGPIGKRPIGHIRRLLVTDALEPPDDEHKKLTIFLLDHFATDSENAQLEGYIIIANFSVEKSTNKIKDEFPVQILVKQDETKVWFARKKSPTISKQKKVKKPIMPGISEESEQPEIRPTHYEYTLLENLRESDSNNDIFHIYGIVEKCDLQTKGVTKLNLVLADETKSDFTCNAYLGRGNVFPNVEPGDVIRIHRLLVKKYRKNLLGRCLNSTDILVFSHKDETVKPRTTAKTFSFTPEDVPKVKDLFKWHHDKNRPKLISEIQREEFVNIICQVIGVYKAKNSDTTVVKIWDGTKSNLIEGKHLEFKEEKLDERLFTLAKSYFILLFAYDQHCAVAQELKPSQFIEICGARLYSPKINPDELRLALFNGNNNDKRGIRTLNLGDSRLAELNERLGKIIADAQEFGNQTDDILSGDNSIFLNCDISAAPPNQRLQENGEIMDDNQDLPTGERERIAEEERANIDALNRPLVERDDVTQDKNVISVIEAAVKPGQSTLEFGEEMQREYAEIDPTQGMELSVPIEQDLTLNKTPVEFRMHLHNPSSQVNTNNLPPFIEDTPEEWWNSITAISATVGHSHIKPFTIAEVIKHEVPYKFRILCVAFSYKPNVKSAEQLICLCCPNCKFMIDHSPSSIPPFLEEDGLFYFYCPECPANGNRPVLKYTFVISFELRDETSSTSLETYLWAENAVSFFKNITPEQVLRDKISADSVLHMLWNICPNNRPVKDGRTSANKNSRYPTLDCCVMSYTVSDQTIYQIFDTELL